MGTRTVVSSQHSSAERVNRDLQDIPGSHADRPSEVPPRGWWQIVRRAWAEAKSDQVPLLAAGVAFYAFLAMFPAMIAAITLYGLLAEPATVARQASELTASLPADAASVITGQLEAVSQNPQQSLGLGLLASVALALWSASGGVGNIVTAVNIAYDEEETRGFIRRKALALILTLGAITFIVFTIAFVAVAPVMLDNIASEGVARWGLEAARWALLIAGVTATLAVVYRYAPDRDDAQFRWVSVGAVTATLIWLLASLGFSLYVDNFSSYSKTYGTLAGVVVLLLWLWITNFVVLLGAEINAEAEQQTVRDTTTGPEKPLGQRGAVKADSLPGDQPPRPQSP